MQRPSSFLARRICSIAAASLLMALGGTTAHAQSDSAFVIRGAVRTAEGVPIDGALLTLANDSSTVAEVRSLPSGSYTMPSLPAGAYTLQIRRIGYETRRLPVQLGASHVLPFDVSLAVLPVTLDAARVDVEWTGVIGVVGDYASMVPIERVRLLPLGTTDTILSDANGRFVLPVPSGGTGALRVERPGYAPRLMSYRVLAGQRVEMAVLIDSAQREPKDQWVWRDLAQRHSWSTPRSVRVARAELLASGAHNLLEALELSPTVQTNGLIFSRGACLFVNGQPRPGFPIDAVVADRVEYVEGYAARGDLSRSLALRWPVNGECGAPGGDPAVRRAIETGRGVQFVAIWLR